MFNKNDLKRFFENKNTSRREFFDYLSKMSLVVMASSLNLSLSEEGQAENINYGGGELFNITDLMNDQCLFCYPVGVCVRILSHKKVCIAPIVSYKIPVGFAETGDAGQFGMSSGELHFLSEDYSYLKNDLNLGNGSKPYIPPGTRYGQVGQGQSKMQLYPHYYGLSPTMIQQVQREMMKVNKLNKACTPCLDRVLAEVVSVNTHQVQLPPAVSSIAEQYITQMYAKYKGHNKGHKKGHKTGPSKEFIQKFYGDKKLADEVFHNLKYVNEHFYKISADYSSAYASNQIPSVPSELFAFIWAFQELSPDEEKWKAIILAIQNAMQQGQIQPYELTCPYMYQLLIQYPEVAQAFATSGFDPSFVCVGLWGNGYPRVGDVETVDPIVGGLLSIARWHHLISTTIKVGERPLVATPPQASWYQVYNPRLALANRNCFQPGWVFSDATENIFNNLLCPEDGLVLGSIQHISGYPSASMIDTYFKDPELVMNTFLINTAGSAICTFLSAAGGSGLSFSNIVKDLGGLAKDLDPLDPSLRNVGIIVYQQHQKCCCPY